MSGNPTISSAIEPKAVNDRIEMLNNLKSIKKTVAITHRSIPHDQVAILRPQPDIARLVFGDLPDSSVLHYRQVVKRRFFGSGIMNDQSPVLATDPYLTAFLFAVKAPLHEVSRIAFWRMLRYRIGNFYKIAVKGGRTSRPGGH